MADKTKIEWTDATANFWIGCTKLSPACDNCYAVSDWHPKAVSAPYGRVEAIGYTEVGAVEIVGWARGDWLKQHSRGTKK